MDAIAQLFVFVFGAVIGSFTNAVIWRLRTGESFVFGRSYCPKCRHELSAWDLVPALSYLFLRGRCRYCRKGIHPQYLIVELFMGVVFLAFARMDLADGFGSSALMALLAHWYFTAILVIVFIYDLKYMLILRSVTLPAVALAVLANLGLGVAPWRLGLGCLVGAGFFYLQHALSRGRWIGGGDIQFGLLMGAMLAWPGTLVALMMSYMVGALFACVLLLTRKKTMQSQLPFGTFLSAATLVTLLWGDRIWQWYFGILL